MDFMSGVNSFDEKHCSPHRVGPVLRSHALHEFTLLALVLLLDRDLRFRWWRRRRTAEDSAQHRAGDRTTHDAVEPVVIHPLGPQLPLIHPTTSAHGPHAILGAHMLGEEAVLLGSIAEEREAARFARRYEQP